jgi:hypothetical protein
MPLFTEKKFWDERLTDRVSLLLEKRYSCLVCFKIGKYATWATYIIVALLLPILFTFTEQVTWRTFLVSILWLLLFKAVYMISLAGRQAVKKFTKTA